MSANTVVRASVGFMDAALGLPLGLEAQFWVEPKTRRTMAVADRCGLAMSICMTLFLVHRTETVHTWLAAALQCAQLAWLLAHERSYMRWRLPLAIVQRMRW